MSDERVRLFVALSLPDPVREALLHWRGQALDALPGLRPVAPDALHVTLCFLGSRPAFELGRIAGACSLVADAEPPRLTIGEALWLPARRPRVLGVSIDDPGGPLVAVQAALAHELWQRGLYTPEKRKFVPHVTVARTRREVRIRPVELEAPPPVPFAGSQVTLYRSWPGRGGSRYEALTTVALGT